MILEVFTQFAETSDGNMLASLGIEPMLLIYQIIAFLLLMAILGRFVFPVFIKIIDKRQAAIEASNKAAIEASKHAEKAQAETEKLLKKARTEASDIVATAKSEAAAMVQAAEEKSKANAKHILTAAEGEIEKEIVAAKKALRNETLELIALATERVVGKTIDASIDRQIIKDALEETR